MWNPFKRKPKVMDPFCTPRLRARLNRDGSGEIYVYGELANGSPVRGIIEVMPATPVAPSVANARHLEVRCPSCQRFMTVIGKSANEVTLMCGYCTYSCVLPTNREV